MATQISTIKRLVSPFDSIVVDGFNFEFPDVKIWFLTHAHADHTIGLRSSFENGHIYCSSITKRLVVRNIGSALAERIVTIDAGESCEIGRTGIEVRAYDAWHCPGSLVFEFRKDAIRCLHTGDMRARPEMIAQLEACPDLCYLDTTYCKPYWKFPSQPEACDIIQRITEEELREEPHTVFICPAYSVGKENAIEACCRGAQSYAIVTQRRAETLRFCQRYREDYYRTAGDDAKIFVESSFGGPKNQNPHDRLKKKLSPQCRRVVMLRCTGWEFKRNCYTADNHYQPKAWLDNDGSTRIYGIPYSEHSSFLELRDFVARVKPRKIIPTVNADTQNQRDTLRDLLVKGTDLYRFDRSKLDFFFLKKHNSHEEKSLIYHTDTPQLTTTKKPPEFIEIDSDSSDDDQSTNSILGAVFDVRAPDTAFKLFKTGITSTASASKKRGQLPGGAADLIRKRLRSLGATVGKPATHILVPEGTQPSSTTCATAKLRVYSESWLVRKLRAQRASSSLSFDEQQQCDDKKSGSSC